MALEPEELELGYFLTDSVKTGAIQGAELARPKYEELFNQIGSDLQGKVVQSVNESIGAQLNSIKAGDVVAGNDAAKVQIQKSSNMGFIILAVLGFLGWRFYKKGRIF